MTLLNKFNRTREKENYLNSTQKNTGNFLRSINYSLHKSFIQTNTSEGTSKDKDSKLKRKMLQQA